MKRWLRITLLVSIIALIVAIILFFLYINKPQPDYAKHKTQVIISAKNIYKDFKDNNNLASLKYNGKVIEIIGKLNKIEKSATSIIIVFVFEQGDFGDQGVRCNMLQDNNKTLNKLSPGSSIKLKGLCAGYNETDVILEKGTIIE